MIVVKQTKVIKVAVLDGERPDITVITGPETLVSLVKDWISRCWHQNPDLRPTFTGIPHRNCQFFLIFLVKYL